MRQGRRARENRWVKKSAVDEPPAEANEGTNTDKTQSGNTAAAIHSQDGTKLQPVMLDTSTFGDYGDYTLFCVTLRDKKHKFFFVKKPEYMTSDFPSRDAKMSFGNKFLAEQEIPVWQKLADADWQIFDEEQKKGLVADQVTILFKNQYFSMRDMHEAQLKMDGEFITVNRDTHIRVAGLDFKIYKILKDGSKINAALFSSITTKVVFASQSAKLTLLVEVSKETFTLSCKKNIKLEDYFMFVKNYLEILDNELCSHDISVLLYGKLFFPCFANINDLYLAYARSGGDCGELSSYQVDKRGRVYKDYIQRVPIPKYLASEKVLGLIRKAFFDFIDSLPMNEQNNIFQTLSSSESTDGQKKYSLNRLKSREDVYSDKDIRMSRNPSTQTYKYTGELSNSSESCILEAVSMVMSSLSIQNDHKCLKSSGYLIVIITPGDGLYHSEEYFFKYVELKALTMDATISLICFEKNIYGNRPTFISVDDEKVIEVLLEVGYKLTYRKIRILLRLNSSVLIVSFCKH